MKVNKYEKHKTFHGEDGETLHVRYDNRGDPYRQGVSLDFDGCDNYVGMFLEDGEARGLRDVLLALYPVDPQ